MNETVRITYKIARRITILVLGSTILAVGIAMMVMPGPGLLVIPIGLAILGLEFAWAKIWLHKLRRHISEQNAKLRGRRAEQRRDRD